MKPQWSIKHQASSTQKKGVYFRMFVDSCLVSVVVYAALWFIISNDWVLLFLFSYFCVMFSMLLTYKVLVNNGMVNSKNRPYSVHHVDGDTWRRTPGSQCVKTLNCFSRITLLHSIVSKKLTKGITYLWLPFPIGVQRISHEGRNNPSTESTPYNAMSSEVCDKLLRRIVM